MKKDIYKFQFQNTFEHISFHDCIIKQLEWDNGNLVLHFDWLDMLKTHPANDTGKAKQTDNALVCFENVKVIKSEWHDDAKAVANAFEKKKKSGDTGVVLDIDPEEIEIKDIDFDDALRGLWIVSLDIERSGETYICKIDGHGLYQDFQDVRDFSKSIREIIEFEYKNARIHFNNFVCDAWFANIGRQ